MPLARVQFVFQGITGLPEDRYVNTLHFESIGAGPYDYGALATAATTLYSNITAPSTKRIMQFVAPAALAASVGGGHRIKIYRLEDAKPRVPVYDVAWTLPGMTAQAALVAEVAFCISYQAAKVSGTDQARRRGRIYFGPLGADAAVEVAGKVRPSTLLLAAPGPAAKAMMASAVTAGWQWVVHSPTTGALATAPVDSVWVDDAFDIQRRRGLSPTAKTVTSVVP